MIKFRLELKMSDCFLSDLHQTRGRRILETFSLDFVYKGVFQSFSLTFLGKNTYYFRMQTFSQDL